MNRMIEWFARNSVAANLIMIVIVVSGMLTIPRLVKEFFPDFELDMISVSVVYRGAAPEEVEEAVVVRVEEAIADLEGIKRITSTAGESVGTVLVELERGAEARKLLDEVKTRVDAIDTFPDETEKPIVESLTNRRQVINVAVHGPADERTLKRLAERVRDDITQIPGITNADLANARPWEISIEVAETALQRHGLTFDEVARAVRRSSLDVPGGSLKTEGGEILLRTKGQAYRGEEFEQLVLLNRPDGTRVRLGDVATVIDGFADTDQSSRFDGHPAIIVQVYRVGDQSILDVSDKVKDYVAQANLAMPAGIELETWQDQSTTMRSRIDLLVKNGLIGLMLVFVVLALFLRFRLSFWVSLGIPISFLGAIWMMPVLDVSVNMISLFAFIVVLGIVVDDAIIVGESIFSAQQRTRRNMHGAIAGAQRVAVPVVFAVLTTIAAFSPLLSVDGNVGKVMRVIPLIVIPCLLFSLVESLMVLPAHLAHLGGGAAPRRRTVGRGLRGAGHRVSRAWQSFQGRFAALLAWFIDRVYRPSLRFGTEWRYLTLAVAIVTLLLTAGLVQGGFVKFVFFPQVEADYIAARVTMALGSPVEKTSAAVARLEESAATLREELEREFGEDVFRHVLASVGAQPLRGAQGPPDAGGASFSAAHLGEVTIELLPAENRSVTSSEIVRRWRAMTGPIPDTQELSFTSSLFSPGDPINVQLTGPRIDDLAAAAARLRAEVAGYAGVYDVTDSYQAGKAEIKLDIKPEAEALGLSLGDLGRQVRQAFYGEEAQRIQRGRDDVRVMVRYPDAQRASLAGLEGMRVRTPGGGEVPFAAVADVELGEGYASIRRVDRRRAVDVTAQVDENEGNANEVLAALERDFLPRLAAEYPGLRYTFEGQGREQRETMASLSQGFLLAVLTMYVLMAVPFRSYVQPLIIMTAIPFGLVGAIWGHVLMGVDLTILSLFGIVALAGVVVNDSLVLVDFVNGERRDGVPLLAAVREAGAARFRPVLLTSLTTFAGLTPLLLERSMQAQFLVPMAISLGFGVVFATFISLMLVPASYLVLEDVKRAIRWLYGSTTAATDETAAPEAAG